MKITWKSLIYSGLSLILFIILATISIIKKARIEMILIGTIMLLESLDYFEMNRNN